MVQLTSMSNKIVHATSKRINPFLDSTLSPAIKRPQGGTLTKDAALGRPYFAQSFGTPEGGRTVVCVRPPVVNILSRNFLWLTLFPFRFGQRPRTAYNYFFHDERRKLLDSLPVTKSKKGSKSNGRIGFSEMAKVISLRWKTISTEQMIHYATLANRDKLRYRQAMEDYKNHQKQLRSYTHAVTESAESNSDAGANIIDYHPIPLSQNLPIQRPTIAELARKLDKDSITFLVKRFKWNRGRGIQRPFKVSVETHDLYSTLQLPPQQNTNTYTYTRKVLLWKQVRMVYHKTCYQEAWCN